MGCPGDHLECCGSRELNYITTYPSLRQRLQEALATQEKLLPNTLIHLGHYRCFGYCQLTPL